LDERTDSDEAVFQDRVLLVVDLQIVHAGPEKVSGRYFARGATSHKRGYYFAYPIRSGDDIAGVAAVKVALETIEEASQTDYTSLAADVFVSKGPFTLEAAYQQLDLDNANPQAEGDGFYVQGGYLLSNDKWQPWFHYETWCADAASGKGSYDMVRVGVSYFMAGHNANFKIGYESFMADALIGSLQEDTINSVVVGFYTTY